MNFMYVVEDSPAARSLILKLGKSGKPGSLIAVTKEEWEEVKKMMVIPVSDDRQDRKLLTLVQEKEANSD